MRHTHLTNRTIFAAQSSMLIFLIRKEKKKKSKTLVRRKYNKSIYVILSPQGEEQFVKNQSFNLFIKESTLINILKIRNRF